MKYRHVECILYTLNIILSRFMHSHPPPLHVSHPRTERHQNTAFVIQIHIFKMYFIYKRLTESPIVFHFHRVCCISVTSYHGVRNAVFELQPGTSGGGQVQFYPPPPLTLPQWRRPSGDLRRVGVLPRFRPGPPRPVWTLLRLPPHHRQHPAGI